MEKKAAWMRHCLNHNMRKSEVGTWQACIVDSESTQITIGR